MPKRSIEQVVSTLDETVIKVMNEEVIPGLFVGIVEDGKLVAQKGYGLADVEKDLPMTADTVFRIASISKTFTAIGLMQLWEQGQFDLDDPINDYLEDFKIMHRDPHAPPITFRHILTHRSGVGETRDVKEIPLMMMGKFPAEVEDESQVPSMGEYVHGWLETDTYPDQKWAYANHAFGTLGELIEDISGVPFTEYMRKNVFEPLGMEKSSYLMTDELREHLAVGYSFKKGKLTPEKVTFFPDMGAGSISSTANEMVLYMSALMNGGANEHGTVLKKETLALMMTPQYREHPRLGAMGLSFFLNDEDGHLIASHGGDLAGYSSEMMVVPQEKLGVIVWSNKNTISHAKLGEEILRQLLDLKSHEERIPEKHIMMPTHLWHELVGSYGPQKGFNSNARIWGILGGEAEVYVRENQLMIRGLIGPLRKGVPLTPVAEDDPLLFESLVFGMPLRAVFQRNAEGYVDRVSMTIMMFFTLYKRPKKQSVRFKVRLLAGTLAGLAVSILGLVCCRKKKG